MRKVLDIVCLCIWIFELIYGIVHSVNGSDIPAIIFVFATIVCVIHHIGSLLNDET